MRILTEDAVLVCEHPSGKTAGQPSQGLVTVAGRRVLVEHDPEGRPIKGCANFIFPTTKPCGKTLAVQAGYSNLLRVNGQRVCLDTVTGLTDGTPPASFHYTVKAPGQDFVAEGP